MTMSDGEKLFMAVVIFLVLKGLLDPKDSHDRERVMKTWRKHRGKGARERDEMPLFDKREKAPF